MSTSFTSFLRRGLIAGAAGGAASGLFLRFLTETQIGYALRFEDATGIGAGPGDAHHEISRGSQQWGGMLGALLFGAVLGIVLGVVLAAFHHRIAARTEFGRAAKVAAAGFLSLTLLPALKYPPNPPAVGDPDTISDRTTAYLLFLAASVLVVYLAWWLWERLTSLGWDGAPRFGVTAGAFVVVTAGLFVVFPASPDRISPPDNEASPALQISADAPQEVLAELLDTARAIESDTIRDPSAPDEPLDLEAVDDPEVLVGAPMALNTAQLVPNAYTDVVWHFRIESIGGLALLWAVMAVVFGLLSDPVKGLAGRRQSPTTPVGA
jgi:hypothetical protein